MDPDTLMSDLSELCRELSLDVDTQDESWKLLERFAQAAPNAPVSLFWPVAAIYYISKKGSDTSFVSLSQLLRIKKLRIFAFFEPLQTFLTTLELDVSIVDPLNQKWLTISALFEKYSKIYVKLFQRTSGKKKKIYDPETIFKFGWTLFLCAKVQIFGNEEPVTEQNLVPLLLSCVNILLVNMPTVLRRNSLFKIFEQLRKAGVPADTLAYICTIFQADYAEIREFSEKTFLPVLMEMFRSQPPTLQQSDSEPDPALPPTCNLHLGLLDKLLILNEKNLCRKYDMLTYGACDLNEKLYLEEDNDQLLPNTVKDWMTDTVGDLSGDPIEEYSAQINSFGPNVLATITELVQRLQTKCTKGLDTEEKQKMAKKLFLHLYTKVIVSEKKRLGDQWEKKEARVLVNSQLVTLLFASCTQIVLHSFYPTGNWDEAQQSVAFPWVLDALEIQPFDFPKIIDCIIKEEPTFPGSLLKHLMWIEESILERYGWREGSPIFSTTYTEAHRAEIMKLLSAYGSSTFHSSPCEAFLVNPLVAVYEELLNYSDSPRPGVQPTADFFLRKVAHLASLRIQALWADLSKTFSYLTAEVELVFLYILTQQSSLLCDRHIDQMIICSFYAVCKAFFGHLSTSSTTTTTTTTSNFTSNFSPMKSGSFAVNFSPNKNLSPVNTAPQPPASVSFTNILQKYAEQPQATKDIFMKVRMDEGKEDDITQFYNYLLLCPDFEGYVFQLQLQHEKQQQKHAPLIELIQQQRQQQQQNSQQPQPKRSQHLLATPLKANPHVGSSTSGGANKLTVMSPGPQRVNNIFVSPIRGKTPLLFKNMRQGEDKMTIEIYSFKSPQKDFERINSILMTPLHQKARKKLEYAEEAKELKEEKKENVEAVEGGEEGGEEDEEMEVTMQLLELRSPQKRKAEVCSDPNLSPQKRKREREAIRSSNSRNPSQNGTPRATRVRSRLNFADEPPTALEVAIATVVDPDALAGVTTTATSTTVTISPDEPEPYVATVSPQKKRSGRKSVTPSPTASPRSLKAKQSATPPPTSPRSTRAKRKADNHESGRTAKRSRQEPDLGGL